MNTTGDTPDTASSAALPSHDQPRPARRRAGSIVLVNTGDGKGKSTAAFGTLMRAVARGWSVGVVQFMKSGKFRVGEEKVARDLGVEWWTIGDGFTWESDDLDRSATIARAAWDHAARLLASGRHDLLVLDEVTYPVNYGWLDGATVCGAIRNRSTRTNVFCTGRDAPPDLVGLADTVTEMRMVKHAYETGVRARRGIDF